MSGGKQFELDVCRLLQRMGFAAEITGHSQDGGIDLVATNPNPLIGGKCVVQCKAWSAPVGEPVLRDLFGTMHAHGANKGVLITTSSFTPAALRFAHGKPLELIDGVRYRELCERFDVVTHDASFETTIDSRDQGDPTHVRLLLVGCSDPQEHKELQALVFTAGTLTITTGLDYKCPADNVHGYCGFSFSRIYIQEARHEMSLTSRLELLFRTHPTEPPTYTVVFEGRSEIVEPLYHAASERMRA